jgi:hypothetical protein
MQKIKITESQLKKLVNVSINESMEELEGDVTFPVKMAIDKHLEKINGLIENQEAKDLIKFIKLLTDKYQDTSEEITSKDLDDIYNQILGIPQEKNVIKKMDNDKFPGGFNVSMNENDNKNLFNDVTNIVNAEIAGLGETPLSQDEMLEVISCGDNFEGNVPPEHLSLYKKLKLAIKSANRKDLKNEFKKIKTILKKKPSQKVNEQIETILLFGLPITTVALLAIGGLLLLTILFRLIRSIPKVTTINYRGPGCRGGGLIRKRQQKWRY